VEWSHGNVRGVAAGVDASGALRLRADDGRILSAAVGEIRFLDANGPPGEPVSP